MVDENAKLIADLQYHLSVITIKYSERGEWKDMMTKDKTKRENIQLSIMVNSAPLLACITTA